MMSIVAACIVFVALLIVAFKVDRLLAAQERFSDRLWHSEQAYREAARAANVHTEAVDKMTDGLTWLSPMQVPSPLPPADEPEATQAGKKRKRSR